MPIRRRSHAFLDQVPVFERLLVDDGILLFKYWLTTDQEQQEERLRERLEDPLKRWKLSPVDLAARAKYDDLHSRARGDAGGDAYPPTRRGRWSIFFNDQKSAARLTLIRDLARPGARYA